MESNLSESTTLGWYSALNALLLGLLLSQTHSLHVVPPLDRCCNPARGTLQVHVCHLVDWDGEMMTNNSGKTRPILMRTLIMTLGLMKWWSGQKLAEYPYISSVQSCFQTIIFYIFFLKMLALFEMWVDDIHKLRNVNFNFITLIWQDIKRCFGISISSSSQGWSKKARPRGDEVHPCPHNVIKNVVKIIKNRLVESGQGCNSIYV